MDRAQDVTFLTIADAAWNRFINKDSIWKKDVGKYVGYYAINPGVYYGDSFTGQSVKTLSGESVTLAGYEGGKLTVNGVKVVESDIITQNGVVHVLERYLTP